MKRYKPLLEVRNTFLLINNEIAYAKQKKLEYAKQGVGEVQGNKGEFIPMWN